MASEKLSLDNLTKGKMSKDKNWHIQKTYNLKPGGNLIVSKPIFTDLTDLPEEIANAVRSGSIKIEAE